MQAARNWVERGHYGRMLDDRPAGANLVFGFPVTGPIAASFRLFGVGFAQARAVTLLYFVLAASLFYLLTAELFDARLALWTTFLSLFLSPLPSASAILLARQVLGEWAMLAFLLAGALSLLAALRGRLWLVPLAALFFATASSAKTQLQPFLAVSLAAVIGVALLRRDRRAAGLVAATLAAAIAIRGLFGPLGGAFLPGWRRDPFELEPLYRVTVFVLDPAARGEALRLLLLAALPAAVGVGHGALSLRRDRSSPEHYVEIFLLALSAAWLVWFAVLSAGWPRYLFPPLYLASPFVVALLRDWSCPRAPEWMRTASLALAVQILATGLWALLRIPLIPADDSPRRVAELINDSTPANARIESFESEILFLLDRPYHYPPIDTHTAMIERHRVSDTVSVVPYDALAADPDYLVYGGFSSSANLYNSAIDRGDFRLWREIGEYRIFERVRRP